MRAATSRSRWTVPAALVLMLLFCLPVIGGLETVAGLFEAGDYQGAKEALEVGGQGARPARGGAGEYSLALDGGGVF